MPLAARVTDTHVCQKVNKPIPVPHTGGIISGPGAITVTIGFLPAAVVGDTTVCVGPPGTILQGSLTVMIEGRPAARQGDPTGHGGSNGNIVMGCPNVMIG
ncbi:MAG: PAAR domain-containing protein [Cytophagales bacterium]|nr:PAAR domain-containing protein [Cytophagales bacterium]